jgi:hypothetical protein
MREASYDAAIVWAGQLGGPYEEIARSEADTAAGRIAEASFVLVAQQCLFDRHVPPAGKLRRTFNKDVPEQLDG